MGEIGTAFRCDNPVQHALPSERTRGAPIDIAMWQDAKELERQNKRVADLRNKRKY